MSISLTLRLVYPHSLRLPPINVFQVINNGRKQVASQELQGDWGNSTQDLAGNLSPPETGYTRVIVGYFGLWLANLQCTTHPQPPSPPQLITQNPD